LIAIADETGGMVVKVPEDSVRPARGARIEVRGPLADPFGQLEVRPAVAGFASLGPGTPPLARAVSSLDESTEGWLVAVTGRVKAKPTKATSGDITLTIVTPQGAELRVMADASSGLDPSSFIVAATYRVVGVAGQRATRKGAHDGYRVWARDGSDVVLLAGPPPSPTPSAAASPKPAGTASPGPTTKPTAVSTIAVALKVTDRDVTIEGVVTAGARLLDATGRRIIVQDRTGAIEVYLPKDTTAPAIRSRVRVVGRVGAAYGAPRLRATSIIRLGSAAIPDALVIRGAVPDSTVWRLVSISGRIAAVHKSGDRWTAEINVGTHGVLVVGQAGAGIPMTTLVVGRAARIAGIVRRAYPSASDRRPSILPRSTADVVVSSARADDGTGGPSGSNATSSGDAGSAAATGADDHGSNAVSGSSSALVARDVDIVDLASIGDETVRIGGLVSELLDDGFRIDDGTSIGRVVLAGQAAAQPPPMDLGVAVNVVGRVARLADGETVVHVDDPTAIVVGSDALAGLAGGTTAAEGPGPGGGAGSESAGLDGAPVGSIASPLAFVGLMIVLVVGTMFAAAVFRRRRQARLLADRHIADRIATFAEAPARSDRPVPGSEGT
jgi:hypothetical protein